MGYIKTEISSADLRKQAPLIRMSKIKVGDVLLTRGTEKDSWKIALGTFGLYSHAGVFVCRLPRKDPTAPLDPLLVESEDLGVGWTEFDPISLIRDQKDAEWIAPLRGAPSTAILLRHPKIDDVPAEALIEASRKLQDEQFFVNYPPQAMLSGAIHAPKSVQSIFRRLKASTMEGVDPLTFGSFCSQLVARFYEFLPIKLFEDDFRAQNVSPNRLGGPDSALEIVPDAFFEGNEIENHWIGEDFNTPATLRLDLTREKWLPTLVNLNVMRKVAQERIFKPFADMMERETPIQRQELRENFEKRVSDTVDSLNKLYPADDAANAAKISEVNDGLAYANVIDGLLLAEEATPGWVREKGAALGALTVTRDIISLQIERELSAERIRRLQIKMPEKKDEIANQWAPLREQFDTGLANLANEIDEYLSTPEQAYLFAKYTAAVDERLTQLKAFNPEVLKI